jgi:tRNA (guanine-N7-)-methyltransferase
MVMFMRQRNVKNKKEIINNSKYIILNPSDYLGNWNKLFNNSNPIYIEIGMGKGDFILENAITYPNINFIGIEKFDSIMALAIKKIDKYELDNLKLIRMDALNINDVFNKEIDKLYLNFSDPWPKERHAKRRLTSEIFLEKYDNIFKNKKIIEMKTDNRNLFEYSLISFNNHGYKINDISLDLHHSKIENNIMTEYEKKFSQENHCIYYVNVEKNG